MPVNSFDSYPLTWKPDKQNVTHPYYQWLARDLEKSIRQGLLKEGTQLPPQREIADYLDVNYTTITRAYDICKKKGLIYGTIGKGTFVAPHSSGDTTLIAPTEESWIELGAINGFCEYSEPIEAATRSVIEKGYLRSLYSYTQPAGQLHQRSAAVRWLEQLSVHTDVDHVAIFSGAQNALTVALISLFSPGDTIAVDTYTYSNFIELAKLLHIKLLPIKGDAEGMDPSELERQCIGRNVKGIYLIPTCANPTTRTIQIERRRALAKVIKTYDLLLIEDDIAAWLEAAAGKLVVSFFSLLGGKSVYICGMTKSLCPGLRIAYMAFPESHKKELMHGLANVNIKTSAFDAEVITELVLNGSAYDIAQKKCQWAQKNNDLFERYFPEACPLTSPVSYYRWLPIETRKPYYAIEEELLRRHVRVYHSGRFAVAPEERPYLRISLCSTPSQNRLEKGFSILRRYLDEIHV